MTFKLHIAGILSLCALSACSTVEDRELASGSFKYLEENPGQMMAVPEGMDKPAFSETFKLPELGENAPMNTMGENLSVLSPALVLPLVSGSHVEEGKKGATIWFDQVDDSQALDTTIWNSLIAFLEAQGIGVAEFDKERQKLVSDWMTIDESLDAKWYSWSNSERTVGQKFEFNLDLKPHGRTAALVVDLVDYKEKKDAESTEITQSRDARRNEVEILNRVIEHYEYEIRLADAKRIRQIRQGLAMELGFDEDGEAAYVVDAGYDIAWPRFLLVLRKLGFDVKDYDKSTGLLFAKFNGIDDGWWDSMWADEQDQLDLDSEDYRFKIGDLGSKTSVTLLDNESNPFPVNKVSDLYPIFSRTMSTEDLDI
ncbi:outer membrane protein assembly factor BamC [Paraglaciecola sp.]|uniref:outer membrane protein assembly factor BamC n=1 Tax=Paraglaciecola sp. TaxID=1920173 RepID=UPI003EF76161